MERQRKRLHPVTPRGGGGQRTQTTPRHGHPHGEPPHKQSRRGGGFAPVGTGGQSFKGVLEQWERTFTSVLTDVNGEARSDELLAALDKVFSVTSMARANEADVAPVDITLSRTLVDQLLLRAFSMGRFQALRQQALSYLFNLDAHHLRQVAATTVRARLLGTANNSGDFGELVNDTLVDTLMRSFGSFPVECTQMFRHADAVGTKLFRHALLDKTMEMLGPDSNTADASTAAAVLRKLCAESPALCADARAAVENLSLSVAAQQMNSIAISNHFGMSHSLAANVALIDELLCLLGAARREQKDTSHLPRQLIRSALSMR
eukprot:COSAG04_NODE_3098_length_3177_cov_1.425926_2_plen_320_part_00